MSTHLININDCTTPTDTAQNFPHLMPLTLYPLEDKSMTTIGKAKVVSQRLRESNRAPGQEGAETIDALIVELEKLEYELQVAEECLHQVKTKFNETLNDEVANSTLEINSLNQVILGLEEAKRDATRWAFFRKQICIGDMEIFERAFACFDGVDECTEAELDTAIDDAIKEQGHAK